MAVIIALQAGAMLIYNHFSSEQNLNDGTSFMMGMVGAAFLVIGQIMGLGFLRSVYEEADISRSPFELILMGRRFFWRIVGFSILLAAASIIISYFTFELLRQFGFVNLEFIEAPLWLNQLYFTPAAVILLKPTLFIPAFVVVVNCRLFESFGYLKKCRLLNAKDLIILFVIAWGLSFVQAFLPEFTLSAPVYQYFLHAFFAGLSVILTFAISLGAVLFIGGMVSANQGEQVTGPVE